MPNDLQKSGSYTFFLIKSDDKQRLVMKSTLGHGSQRWRHGGDWSHGALPEFLTEYPKGYSCLITVVVTTNRL
jgi:hypothetical protein